VHHPYYYSSYGSLESLPRLSATDVRNFHAQQYGADGMIMVVVGAVKAADVVELVADKLADWTNPQQAPTPTLETVTQPPEIVQSVLDCCKTQSDVMSAVGPRFADDYLASLANSILSGWHDGAARYVIREEVGLAYYAWPCQAGGQGAWHVVWIRRKMSI
jgi:zinc protease